MLGTCFRQCQLKQQPQTFCERFLNWATIKHHFWEHNADIRQQLFPFANAIRLMAFQGIPPDERLLRDSSSSSGDSLPGRGISPSSNEIQSSVRSFLKEHTAYDVLPVSYRLIVFDTRLLVKKALAALVQNGIVSAPIWSSERQQFAGMLTVSDFLNLIQYYYKHSCVEDALRDIEKIEIRHLRDIERRLGAPAPQLLSMHPMSTLYDACRLLAESRAHRVPLLDHDETGTEMIVSVITQYRILKFIAVNYKDTRSLRRPLSELRIGTYQGIAVASLSTPVIQVINMFVDKRISAVPIVDENDVVLNVYETVDVMSIARAGRYNELDIPVGEALEARPKDYPGVHTCTLNDTLYSIFQTIRRQRVYRLIVVDQDKRLVGIVSLSDILGYLVGYERS